MVFTQIKRWTLLLYSFSHNLQSSRFVKMSACTSSVSEVKEVVKVARNEKRMFGRQTVLFMDEVHRFNKLQQDAFLPHVEDGTVTLVGATTENPSFSLNKYATLCISFRSIESS